MKWTSLLSTALVASVVLFGGHALAQETSQSENRTSEAPREPSGLVSIEETQFGLIIGGSYGGGVLTYEGKSYDFQLGGLSLGANVGVSRMAAVGQVYELQKLEDFPGTYVRVEGSVTLGGGVGGMTLKNENGVLMRLSGTSQGLQLNVGASGVSIYFDGDVPTPQP